MSLTVARADAHELALWAAAGTPCIYPLATDGAGRIRHPTDWVRRERRWHGTGVLHRIRPEESHSLLHFWQEDGRFAGWYVNLQAPLRPSRHGFDTEDHLLDVWVAADGSWRWKDEEHLVDGIARSEEHT